MFCRPPLIFYKLTISNTITFSQISSSLFSAVLHTINQPILKTFLSWLLWQNPVLLLCVSIMWNALCVLCNATFSNFFLTQSVTINVLWIPIHLFYTHAHTHTHTRVCWNLLPEFFKKMCYKTLQIRSDICIEFWKMRCSPGVQWKFRVGKTSQV